MKTFPQDPEVGLVGIGLLGTALAARLIEFGHSLLGFDLAPDRIEAFADMGGIVATSASEVFRRCSRVVLCLPTSDIVAQLLDGNSGLLRRGRLVIDTTTGSPAHAEEVARRLAERGVGYLDATVSGSSAQARRGDVILMVGGDPEAFDLARDLLEALARRVFHVGPAGAGSRMKLATNLVLGLNRAALAEGLSHGVALGLDPSLTLEVLRASAAYSRVMDTKGLKMVSGDFAPEARLAQHLKDVRLILETAEAAGVVLPLSRAHQSLLEAAEAAGYADADNSAVIRAYDRRD